MATYEITSPSGDRFEVTAPDTATQEQVLSYARQQWERGTVDQSIYKSVGQAAVRGVTGMLDAASMATNMMAGKVGSLPGGSNNVSLTEGATDLGLTYENLEDLPRTHRPAAVAAETFTGALLPGGIAARASSMPARFLAGEAAASFGAAQGGAIAEVVAPSNPWARAGSEIAGGFVSPSSLVAKAVNLLRGTGAGIARSGLPAVTRGASERRAADIVQRVVRDSGEDPEALARILEAADPNNLTLTSAQKTGSDALYNLEAKISQVKESATPAIDEARNAALTQLRETIDALSSTGNPEAVRAAANLRQRYINGLLQSHLDNAVREADAARAAVGGAGREGEIAASVQAEKVINEAWDDAIETQGRLWEAIPDNVTASADDTLSAYRTVRAEMLKDDSIDPVLEATFSRFSGNRRVRVSNPASELQSVRSPAFRARTQTAPPEKPTSGDLKNIRSRARSMNRQARASGDGETAHRYRLIAEGADSDLMKLDLPGAEEAREFTRSMHEAFTKTFARDVLRETPVGGDRIAPEVTLNRAFGPQSGGAQAGVNLRQLQGAAEFPEGVAAQTGPAMRGAQEQFLRSRAGGMTRPGSEALNPNQLDRLAANNPETMQRFPGVARDVSRASQAERGLSQAQRTVQTRTQRAENTFKRVLGAEDPVQAVGKIVNGANPTREYLGLARLVRRSGPEAIEGLKSATLKDAIRRSTGARSGFSFAAFQNQLIDGGTLNLMQRANLMSTSEANRLRQIVTRAKSLQTKVGDAKSIETLVGAPDALLDFVVRVASIKAGTMVHRATPGALGAGELVIAGQASRTGRNLFEKIPAARTTDILVEAAMNPQFMAALLRKPTTAAGKRALASQINGFLIQAGLVEPSQEIGEMQE